MDLDKIPHRYVDSVSFSVFSTEELLRQGVLEVTCPETFDIVGHPTKGGLHDALLGPSDRDEVCATCGLGFTHCPGHIGYIKMPLLVFNPVFIRTLFQLVRGSCLSCHRLLSPPVACQVTLAQLQVLQYGAVATVQELQDVANEILAGDDDRGKLRGAAAIGSALQRRIEQCVASVMDGVGDAIEARRAADVKNVVECRQRIVKTFIREHLMGAPRKCPHCGELRRAMSIHNNSRFVYTSKIRPVAKPPVSFSVPMRRTYQGFQEEVEDGPEEGEEADQRAQVAEEEGGGDGGALSYLTPVEARAHLRQLWNHERPLLQHLFGVLALASRSHESPVDMFFLEALVVPPTRFRPMNFLHGRKYEHPQTVSLSKVVQCCDSLKAVLRLLARKASKGPPEEDHMELDRLEQLVGKLMGKDLETKMHLAWHALQVAVNVVVDSELDRLNTSASKGTPGIKQILEKKEGLFRKHMMGKRVNYAARSVISPDPYIDVEEIGVPMVFATRLSYPEPVTERNIAELRRAVINGPDVYPGALLVEREDGVVMRLDPSNRTRREAVAKQLLTPAESQQPLQRCKTVHRHLRSGDMLLLNRQPTLHKPSIMAHRARVLAGERTLRLHYANCKCYNADFDGDEMNAHLPQSPLAQAEASEVATVNRQYLVPKDGSPLSGLIQDHVIGGSLLTMQGRFFTREDYNQLVFGALSFVKVAIKLLPPAIFKPQPLWTGKQVLSTVLLNCIPPGKPAPTIEGQAKIPAKAWSSTVAPGGCMTEADVIIRKGELLCGVLDKAHYGPTQFGLVHVCYELYGGATSSLVLSAFARLFTHYLQIFAGFTLGIEDILVTDKANRKRQRIMKKARRQGDAVALEALGLDDEQQPQLEEQLRAAHMARTDRLMKQLDACMKSVTDDVNNQINKACIPDGLWKKFPANNLQLMVQSGAKGGMVNCMQISCLLGQIELEGRRVPLMLSGRTLPSFGRYDRSPRAGGFVDGRFLTGIRPQEYFFHCMAGREGLVDTAVKTSRSGYLQRCLIKHLEGLMVCYDQTVRDSDGSVIQFQYGEDGLDVLKMQMLKTSQFPVLIKNAQALINREDIERCQSATDSRQLHRAKRAVRKWRKKQAGGGVPRRQSAFTIFSQTEGPRIHHEHRRHFPEATEETAARALVEAYANLDERARHKLNKCVVQPADPVCSQLRSDVHLGAVSERLDALIEDYVERNPHGLLVDSADEEGISTDDFRNMVYMRNMQAICDPGEPVGLLAAQSIGEPSTQMTLNTFHFAGRGEMNVTLGIPRMREILMVASANIATPTMDLHLLPRPDAEQRAEELRVRISSVNLSQVLERVTVREMLHVRGKSERFRRYRVHFQFLPRRAYRKTLHATPARILRYMETTFLRRLVEAIKRRMEEISSERMTHVAKARERRGEAPAAAATEIQGGDDLGESSDEGEEGDGDTLAHQAATRHTQEQEYEEAEEEERLALQAAQLAGDEELLCGDENPPGDAAAVAGATADVSAEEIVASIQEGVRSEEAEKLRQTRIFAVVKYSSWVLEYDYDDAKEEWCTFTFQLALEGSRFDLASLVEEESSRAVLHAVPHITRAFLVKDTHDKSGCGKMLRTEGVNFVEMFRHGAVIDLKRIYSNDIHTIANTFGIEAARTAIAREVANVFAVYGIEVDPRHLLLVADYMTFDGSYRACNRIAMENNASPLQQMTFETTMNFLKSATLAGAQDHLNSPSARLVVGRVVPLGTGCMQLRQPQAFKLRQ